jgi:uncharacterized protein (TIGR02996 family)
MTESMLLEVIQANPADEVGYLALADWLEEHDDLRRAELLRLHRRLLDTCCEPAQHPQRAGWQSRLVQLLAEGVRPCLPQRSVVLGDDVALTFSFIGPGTFLMGSPPSEAGRSDDETQHRVTLTKGFWLAVTPLTQAQWQAVLGSNPSHFKGADRPVEQVSWDDCQEFCRKLGERTGKTFRLPTEAEWEYACRAGTTTPFHNGCTLSTEQANYDGNHIYGQGKKGVYRHQTTPVSSFPPNPWGLCDMHGNVWEWCADWYGPYAKRDFKDPEIINNGDARVLRGGSWDNSPRYCRSAYRRWGAPGLRRYHVGCRLVLCLD